MIKQRENAIIGISEKRTGVWSTKLIFLLVIAGFCLISSHVFAADEPLPGTVENVFLDPFALTAYQAPKASSKDSTDEDELLTETMLFAPSTSNTTFAPRSIIPIGTLRHWRMIPYRPPLRSPFLPW